MSQLRHSYLEFRELNAEVIAVAAVGLRPLAKFARELELPFPVLSEATAEIYRAFGLGKGLTIRPRTVVTAVQWPGARNAFTAR